MITGPRSLAASRHASADEATDRLYWLLTHLDAERTVPWGEVERRAISRADGDLPWLLLEGPPLAAILRELRDRGQRLAG